ncbi:hypothetical protein Pla52n_28220 [Stieleria varia]|uniref:Uncharacterized protein n=1 Tax=Stieleria varia TaxID=2528005 RepID=A0A5C6AYN0_9BACT|nr:hypothetical protein Pla52n_28220 [Stieleria varia]
MANLKLKQVFIQAIPKHFGADQVAIMKVAPKGQPIRCYENN